MPQERERIAEVVAANVGFGVGPEHLDECFARMRRQMKGQIGQQGGGLLGAEAGDLALFVLDAQPSQEEDGPGWGHERASERRRRSGRRE